MNQPVDHSWIIPAYQDEGNLEAIVGRSIGFLEKLGRSYEIILVNDGSTDQTAVVIEKISRETKTVRCISHAKNRGYGQALQSGFRAARAERFIGYTDGDGQYDPMDLFASCQKIRPEDRLAVIGYKTARQDSFLRVQQSRVYNELIRKVFGVRFRDINCSLKWFPASILGQIKIHSQSSFIDAEILLALKQAGIEFLEVPVRHFARQAGRGFGAKPKVILSTLLELFTHTIRNAPSSS